MSLTAECRSGCILVDTGRGPVFWLPETCRRMADRWEPRGGDWAAMAKQLRNALQSYHQERDAA